MKQQCGRHPLGQLLTFGHGHPYVAASYTVPGMVCEQPHTAESKLLTSEIGYKTHCSSCFGISLSLTVSLVPCSEEASCHVCAAL